MGNEVLKEGWVQIVKITLFLPQPHSAKQFMGTVQMNPHNHLRFSDQGLGKAGPCPGPSAIKQQDKHFHTNIVDLYSHPL